MRERTVESYLKRRVKELGGRCYKWSSPGRRGAPDQIIFLMEKIWFVEVKSPTGELSRLQEMFKKELIDCHGHFVVVNSKDSVDQWLEEVQNAV